MNTHTAGRTGSNMPMPKPKRCATRSCFFDQTSFAKFIVQGRDAMKVLNRVSVNNVDTDVDKLVYTQWCNERGGIEADLTVTRLGEDEFMVVTGAAPADPRYGLAEAPYRRG